MRFEYNDRNLVEKRVTITPDGEHAEIFLYNADGQVKSHTDATQIKIMAHYDGYGRLMATVDPAGTQHLTVYDDGGDPAENRSCDSESLLAKTSLEYDSVNLLKKRTDHVLEGEGDQVATYTYDGRSRPKTITDARNSVFTYGYDDWGREKFFSASGAGSVYNRTVTDTDARGNPTQITESGSPGVSGIPSTFITTIQYDNLDRPKTVVDGLGNQIDTGYDDRNNVVSRTLPGSSQINYKYDGLDRLEELERVTGTGASVKVNYLYLDLPDSRQVTMSDQLSNQTIFNYNGYGLVSSIQYSDQTTASFLYDAAGRLDSETLPNGAEVDHMIDSTGRLEGRQITFTGAGGAGHLVEGYEYDGLSQVKVARHGSFRNDMDYDSLGRVESDKMSDLFGWSETVGYGFDGVGNKATINYPSSLSVQQEWTAFNVLGSQEIQVGGATVLSTSNHWQGALRGSTYLGSINVDRGYDEAQMLQSLSIKNSSNEQIHHETLFRDGRGLLTSRQLEDRNGMGWSMSYDGAGRLLNANLRTIANDGTASVGDQTLTSRPDSYVMSLDGAENLTEIRRSQTCGHEETIALPLATGGRNRPEKIGNVDLAWDAAGNLTEKGDLRFTYDYLNRLIAVDRQVDTTTESVITYDYGFRNRRIRWIKGGDIYYVVWDDLRPVELYKNSKLITRWVYGAYLDEIVRFEVLHDGDTQFTVYTPVYDSIGNIVAMLDSNGDPVERYEYDPSGHRYIWSDTEPPVVEQVRLSYGQILVEFSEEVRGQRFEGALSLSNVTQENKPIPVSYELSGSSGRRARHQLVITLEPTNPEDLQDGDSLQLQIPASALMDIFGNQATADPPLVSFAWSPTDFEILSDLASPRLLEACVKNGTLRLQFSEIPDETLDTEGKPEFSKQLMLDGQMVSWALKTDGYTLELLDTFDDTDHTLTLGNGPFDLVGKGLTNSPTTLTFDGSQGDYHLWSIGLPGEKKPVGNERAARSNLGNPFGFHGLPVDPETGFIYMRNRYYDPDMGRFVSTDPLGYTDGPNLYQFALNDPINLSDPTGEIAVIIPIMILAGGAIWGATEEIERATDLDPHANLGVASIRGGIRGTAIAAVGYAAGTFGGGVAAGLGLGVAAQGVLGGALAGTSSVFATDLIDVGLYGHRENFSSPGLYAGSAALGGILGYAGARGATGLISRYPVFGSSASNTARSVSNRATNFVSNRLSNFRTFQPVQIQVNIPAGAPTLGSFSRDWTFRPYPGVLGRALQRIGVLRPVPTNPGLRLQAGLSQAQSRSTLQHERFHEWFTNKLPELAYLDRSRVPGARGLGAWFEESLAYGREARGIRFSGIESFNSLWPREVVDFWVGVGIFGGGGGYAMHKLFFD